LNKYYTFFLSFYQYVKERFLNNVSFLGGAKVRTFFNNPNLFALFFNIFF